MPDKLVQKGRQVVGLQDPERQQRNSHLENLLSSWYQGSLYFIVPTAHPLRAIATGFYC
jgi:hypothetical protein